MIGINNPVLVKFILISEFLFIDIWRRLLHSKSNNDLPDTHLASIRPNVVVSSGTAIENRKSVKPRCSWVIESIVFSQSYGKCYYAIHNVTVR